MVTRMRTRPATARDGHAQDRGCQYAARCTACPWVVCVKELPTSEHLSFVAALRLVRRYLPAPDRTIAP